MLNISKNSALTLLLFSILAINISYASDLQSANISLYINGTQLSGQSVPLLHSQSQVDWRIHAVFGGLEQNISGVLNQSQINYTDSSGTTSVAASPLLINWTTNPELATYVIDRSKPQPIYLLSSNTTLGSVSQAGLNSNAASAPACPSAQLYTEWDFYVTITQGYFTGSKNIVVGRVCFYAIPAGNAYALPKNSINQFSSTVTLTSGIQQENIILNYNSTSARSSDGLAQAQWQATHVYGVVPPPSGVGYVAINGTSSGQWYVQTNATYSRWYNQYYKFTQSFIPQQAMFYGPNNIGILSNNCNVVSTANLTNASVANALQCMNDTAAVYYSHSNAYAQGLVSSTQNISGYTTSAGTYNGNPAIIISLPSSFILEPKLDLNLSGSFVGIQTPAGKPEIISSYSTSLNSAGIGSIISQIENTGDSPALFNITLGNCPGVSVPSGISYQLTQGQGEEVSTGIVAANSSKIINQQCTVILTDMSAGASASTTVTITSGPAQSIINAIEKFLKSL